MKLIPIILAAIFFAFIAEPVYSDPIELNILVVVGDCSPEYVVTIQLLPETHDVIYKLFDPKALPRSTKEALLKAADIPLYLVDTSGCA